MKARVIMTLSYFSKTAASVEMNGHIVHYYILLTGIEMWSRFECLQVAMVKKKIHSMAF